MNAEVSPPAVRDRSVTYPLNQQDPLLVIGGIEQLLEAVDTEVGVSTWHDVRQDMVDDFARITGDHQWLHVDVDQAARGPFGGTIAHGYLTVGLLPMLIAEVVDFDAVMTLNYGMDRVRFPEALPVGTRVRGRVRLAEVSTKPGGHTVRLVVMIEGEGVDKPVCVAEIVWVVRFA